ncbi:MAG: HEAT repeat domain-containing protein [Deltaproteobacteria bacterium]|nr:HEAT repeat domain-containing protein [Deltaproteobacteria bacterium]
MRSARIWAGVLSACVMFPLLGGCEGDPATPEYWVKALTERKTRDQALKDIRKEKLAVHVDGLIALSKDEDDLTRPDVAQLLGQIGEKFPETREKVGPALKEMADYGVGGASDKASRAKNNTNKNICDAMARIHYSAGAEVLVRLLDSKDQNTRLAAVTALGEIDATSATDKLIKVVEEDDNNFMVKNAIKALGNIGDAKAVPALVRMLFFERAVSFYAESSYALFQIGKPAVPALVDTLGGKKDHLQKLPVAPDPWIVKAKCIEVLADIGDAKAGEAAMSVLKAPDSGVAFQIIAAQKAATAAGRLGVKDAVPFLRKMASSIDVTQAELPLEALELIGDRAAGAEMVRLAATDVFMADCQKQFDAEACKNSAEEVRQLRLEAGTRLAGASELGAVEKMEAAEKDAKLKEMIGKEKARLVAAKECGDKAECWAGKLKDPNPKVRDKAGWELSWAKKADTSAALIEALKDEDLEARFAVFVALSRLMPKEGADKVAAILKAETGKLQFIKINEDLKRLEIKMRRGY